MRGGWGDGHTHTHTHTHMDRVWESAGPASSLCLSHLATPDAAKPAAAGAALAAAPPFFSCGDAAAKDTPPVASASAMADAIMATPEPMPTPAPASWRGGREGGSEG